jgi:AcrR family transcriptional regulator
VPVRDRDNRNVRGLATARSIERHAVRLATETGVDNLTVDRICAAVGITQRTFFNHFPTKEDALLGIDLPYVDEQRAREYLADPAVGILTGAVDLIRLPQAHLDEPDFFAAQLRLLATSTTLRNRQAERFLPLAHEVEELIYLKLRAGNPSSDEETLRAQASIVTSLGGGLINRTALETATGTGTGPLNAQETLESLRPIWTQLL